MTKILTDESIEHAWKRKAASCEERGISFELTLPQYRALMRARSTMVCFYTGKQFDLRSTDNPAYPSIDRLDDTKAYSTDNVVLCHTLVNRIKSEVVESGQGLRKGMDEKEIRIARSIQKVLSQPEIIKQRLKPYQEIFDKVAQREQEQLDKQTRKQELSEACEKAKRVNEAKDKAEGQLTLSKHYTAISAAFGQGGLVYDVSIKQHRDKFRKQYCALTGSKFESMMDKYFWIPDQEKVRDEGIVSAGDFIVTTVDSSVAVDNLKKVGKLKDIGLNILKHV